MLLFYIINIIHIIMFFNIIIIILSYVFIKYRFCINYMPFYFVLLLSPFNNILYRIFTRMLDILKIFIILHFLQYLSIIIIYKVSFKKIKKKSLLEN
jgi:hypothetical protein